MTGPAAGGDPRYRQDTHVESGVAFGVIDADLHVWGGSAPLFLLEAWRETPDADPARLRELPGRLLNVRDEAVEFTGRAAELSQLRQWRQGDTRYAARWLYGPAGTGKTRLAAKFASESAADNWKVVTATLGTGTALPTPDSTELKVGTADGVLLIVDDASRWPGSCLARLLSDKLFRRRPDGGVRMRILMTGASADAWPGIRNQLSGEQAATSSQRLAPRARS
jgi:hypothetical protein